MKTFNSVFLPSDPKNRLCLFSFFVAVSLICGAYFIGNAFITKEYKEKFTRWGLIHPIENTKSSACKNQCRPSGSETLPEGIVAKESNLEMRPLWCSTMKNRILKSSKNLLAIAVGIKQKEIVNQIVGKFPLSDFIVMLFHYDGVVDGWKDFAWSDRAIHVSAKNQTKWWFAKRFLHPDIVAEYSYIFLWDEDIGVEHFDPKQYLSIVKEEGLEISQPALDAAKSEVHHPLTVRRRRSKVHRRFYKFKGSGRCDEHSTAPPCIGWVEMMAPVFSREAWQCIWYMIQNDLIHAWGLDMQLGYCARGDRMKNVGVIDSEYIVHLGLPTLGASHGSEFSNAPPSPQKQDKSNSEASAPLDSQVVTDRSKVRMQSYIEMQIFKKRWNDAVKEDKCWIDPYQQHSNQTGH
ncbi:Lysine ketoglutarate reductase trans-splicing-like protein, putative (DUF707) [Quillaja saponaria]|uniref:Lysine ketoglutarate reductase trans-splicing-like protein, putative (DUF707) n=1 Tax=Quillaja saponaria TaxID=32244 RepID=A0AAD7M0Z1_QUISA|nr:Lysine ketoglutarate reductase trans-splicing-like protein, putative (DUF707) [Quillaja saponaria]KAJ7967954.1 Lysine ketoglutarate reductase trans-splicing-like protein, putative (DUF707) [Quillaja saponaria]